MKKKYKEKKRKKKKEKRKKRRKVNFFGLRSRRLVTRHFPKEMEAFKGAR